jgi:hypothetical protein
MGRKASQVLLVNFSLLLGTIAGIKVADLLFWNEEIKYKTWEETENEFWKENGYPKILLPSVSFESVINPGTIYKSYLPEAGLRTIDETLDKYQI